MSKIKKLKRIGLLLTALAVCVGNTYAYTTTWNDLGKFYQVRSMEDGYWGFYPNWYYYAGHKNYSGAEYYFDWSEFEMTISFKHNKSNVQRIAPVRAAEILEEGYTKEHLQVQIDSLQPLLLEETLREVERDVNVVYSVYKNDFKQGFDNLNKLYKKIKNASNADFGYAYDRFKYEIDLLEDEVEYFGKTGRKNQMEGTKRANGYEELREKLKELYNRGVQLYKYALTHYSKKK